MRRRLLIAHIRENMQVSQRRACRALGIARSTVRYIKRVRADEEALRAAIIEKAREVGSYGYRQVALSLRQDGWQVGKKLVYRIWCEEGLKVPRRQKKRRHLWLNNGSCVRLRPEYRNHVWSYDFVSDRLSNGRPFRMLTVLDEYTRECLAIVVGYRLSWEDVIECLEELFILRGMPAYLRSDNGAEFTTPKVREWLRRLGVQTAFIEPGSPWENGYNEAFNGTLRRDLLNREVFDTLLEAEVLIERYRRFYNGKRPHSSLGGRPPAPETIIPVEALPGKDVLLGPKPAVERCRLN